MIKLRILRWGYYPGISRWVLNVESPVLIKEKQREIGTQKRLGNMTMEAGAGLIEPQAEECWQPPEAGRGKEGIFPRSLVKEHGTAYMLILVQGK